MMIFYFIETNELQDKKSRYNTNESPKGAEKGASGKDPPKRDKENIRHKRDKNVERGEDDGNSNCSLMNPKDSFRTNKI